MMDKLKPCPFCGGTQEDGSLGQCSIPNQFSQSSYMHHVECECDAKGEPKQTWEWAIDAWNTRPREDVLEDENKRLRDALKRLGSNTAMSKSNVVRYNDPTASEIRMRIIYARKALNGDE